MSAAIRPRLRTVTVAISLALVFSAVPALGASAATPPPANDAFADAAKITSLPFAIDSAPFGGATLEAGEPRNCRTTDPDETEYFTPVDESIWYSYTSPIRQTLTFTGAVAGRYVVVNAYAAAPLTSLQRISCVEEGFRDEGHLQAEAGKTYYFQVGDAYTDQTPLPADATASLTLSASAPIPNTTFATATPVTVPSTIQASLANVDFNWYSPYVGCRTTNDYTPMGSLWYRYTPTTTGPVKVDVGDSHYNADFAVYASDGTTPGAAIACPVQDGGPASSWTYSKAAANATFTAEAGKTYFIQLGGYYFSSGDAVMTLTNAPLPPLTLTPTPTISGTARIGSTLTANPGTWDAGTTLAFQWKRNGGQIIAGATQPTYTPTWADFGATLTVSVTATKAGYSPATKTSAPTAKVALGTLTAPVPTITGSAKVGQTLTAKAGTWTPAPDALIYQWLRNGVAIPGANATTYRLASADTGKKITVTVAGVKIGYVPLVKTSAPTVAVG